MADAKTIIPVAVLGNLATSLLVGTSGSPASGAKVGNEVVSIFSNPTLTNGTRNTTLRVESYLNCTDTFAAQGSGLYTIRGLAGTKTQKTFKGSANQGYLAGVQGKLDNKGVIGDNNSGGIYACAVLAQVSGAGTWGTDAQLYGLWVDFQAGMGTLPSTAMMVNITNNSGKTVLSAVHVGAENLITNLLTVVNPGGMVVAISGHTTMTKAFKITIDGTAHYIPVLTGTT